MPAWNEWNELVLPEDRLESPNKNTRKTSISKPSHIVIHITGDDNFSSVKNTFLSKNSVSAHYLIGKDGKLYQFAQDAYRAWHAGIDTNSRSLYKEGANKWKCYLKYFNWYKNYPNDAVFVDGDLTPVWDKSEASYVMRADGIEWNEYSYFTTRWGVEEKAPVNFASDNDPNNFSIGIEIMSLGSRNKNNNVYTTLMYSTLQNLIKDLSIKYSIPIEKGFIIGHEDVNPLARFGWDPNQGFDWSKIYTI
jgi:N-acetyl-anhydromuramyl-L-alanine amidase AmpD